MTAVITGLRGSAFYARGLWDRLNGGGRRPERSGMPFGLLAPRAQRERRVAAIARLLREINALEQRVQEASKARHLCTLKAGGAHSLTQHVCSAAGQTSRVCCTVLLTRAPLVYRVYD